MQQPFRDNEPESQDWTLFKEALEEAFGDPEDHRTALKELRKLRQTGSVAEYHATFSSLSKRLTEGHRDDEVLREIFWDELSLSLKKDLYKTNKNTSTLRRLYSEANRLYNIEQKIKAEEKKQGVTARPRGIEPSSKISTNSNPSGSSSISNGQGSGKKSYPTPKHHDGL